jgi:predicted DNA-binding WGR domain protein
MSAPFRDRGRRGGPGAHPSTRSPSSRARRYTAHVQPSLFGGVDVVREWGRVDTMHRPRRLVTEHESEAAALAALNRVVALRLRRGYRPDNSQVVEALAQPVPANGPGDPGVGRATSVDLMGNCPGPGLSQASDKEVPPSPRKRYSTPWTPSYGR